MEELLWSELPLKRDGTVQYAKAYIYSLKYLSITSSFENVPIPSQQEKHIFNFTAKLLSKLIFLLLLFLFAILYLDRV